MQNTTPFARIARSTTQNGGGTYCPRTGASHDGPGYAVGADPAEGRNTITPLEDFLENGPRILAAMVRQNADLLEDPRYHIGTWLDTSTNLVHLEPSEVLPDAAAAILAGRERNQIAIYDFAAGRLINTGGTGE